MLHGAVREGSAAARGVAHGAGVEADLEVGVCYNICHGRGGRSERWRRMRTPDEAKQGSRAKKRLAYATRPGLP